MSGIVKKCPVCEGEVYLCHKGTRDDESIDVYVCRECGTKFLSELERQNDYENGFMRRTPVLSDAEIQEVLLSCRDDDMRRFNMVKDICANKRVLDFGCGYGGFLRKISEVADSCMGVELGKCERQYLKGNGIECVKDIDECDGKFDVITLFHVFEHLSNPTIWLGKISEHLKDGRHLAVEVPNANDALLNLYESESFADFTYWSAHLFLYTAESLSMVIEESGLFDTISAGYVQRYSIANHLMWLAKGMPGGHNKWKFLDTDELNAAYTEKLMELGMCDTLFFVLRKR